MQPNWVFFTQYWPFEILVYFVSLLLPFSQDSSFSSVSTIHSFLCLLLLTDFSTVLYFIWALFESVNHSFYIHRLLSIYLVPLCNAICFSKLNVSIYHSLSFNIFWFNIHIYLKSTKVQLKCNNSYIAVILVSSSASISIFWAKVCFLFFYSSDCDTFFSTDSHDNRLNFIKLLAIMGWKEKTTVSCFPGDFEVSIKEYEVDLGS